MNVAGGHDRKIGFGIHQGVELLLGIFLVISSTRVTEGGAGAVLGLGVLLLVLPAVTTGPLAALRVLPPSAHRVLDVLVVMAAVTSPLLPLGLEGNAIPLTVLTGVGMAVLTRATSYSVGRPRRSPDPLVEPAPARPTRAPAAPHTPAWARGAGKAVGRARTQLPRQAGRMVGRLKKGRP